MRGDLFAGPAVAPELKDRAVAPPPVSLHLAAGRGAVDNRGGSGSAHGGTVLPRMRVWS
jgi:hypothetical protein